MPEREEPADMPTTLVRTAQTKRPWDLTPTSHGEAMEIAKIIADSDFAPKDYRGKPANVLIAVQMGLDVGLKPMQAIQSIAIVNGRPSVYGDAALALVMASGLVEQFRESEDGGTATCTIKRKGLDAVTHTFGLDDAKTAGLLGKAGPWTNYPKRMRQMRARGYALRDAFPDVLMGLSIAEEVQDINSAPVLVTDAALVNELTPEQEERIGKAFDALNLSEAQRRVFTMKHLNVADRPMKDSVEALIDDLKNEYAKRKTGKPAARKTAKVIDVPAEPEKQADSQPEPEAQAESLVVELDKGPVQSDEDKQIDAEAAQQETVPAKAKGSTRFAF